jgi:hypothetical protein
VDKKQKSKTTEYQKSQRLLALTIAFIFLGNGWPGILAAIISCSFS